MVLQEHGIELSIKNDEKESTPTSFEPQTLALLGLSIIATKPFPVKTNMLKLPLETLNE